jgi:hypothetical protein
MSAQVQCDKLDQGMMCMPNTCLMVCMMCKLFTLGLERRWHPPLGSAQLQSSAVTGCSKRTIVALHCPRMRVAHVLRSTKHLATDTRQSNHSCTAGPAGVHGPCTCMR